MKSYMDAGSAEDIGGRWKWYVGIGIVIAIFGLIALLNVVDATLVTTVLLGFVVPLGGLMQIVGAFAGSGSTGSRVLNAILGILFAIIGFNIVADPLSGAIALTLVIAVVLIADGLIRLVGAFSQPTPNRGLVVIVAIVNIVLGIWLWSGIPVSGIAIGFFVGLQLVMAGILWMAIGWAARSQQGSAAIGSAA